MSGSNSLLDLLSGVSAPAGTLSSGASGAGSSASKSTVQAGGLTQPPGDIGTIPGKKLAGGSMSGLGAYYGYGGGHLDSVALGN